MDHLIQLPKPQVVPPVSSSEDLSFEPFEKEKSQSDFPISNTSNRCYVNFILSHQSKQNSPIMARSKISRSQMQPWTYVQEVKERPNKVGNHAVFFTTLRVESREGKITDKTIHMASIEESNLSHIPLLHQREGTQRVIPDTEQVSIPSEPIGLVHLETVEREVSSYYDQHPVTKVTNLMDKFTTVFQSAMHDTSAKLTTFERQSDQEQWRSIKNKHPRQKLDLVQEQKLNLKIKALIDAKTITACNEPNYLHPIPFPA